MANNGCPSGKAAFTNIDTAHALRRKIATQNAKAGLLYIHPLNVYTCPHCGAYHVGHDKKALAGLNAE